MKSWYDSDEAKALRARHPKACKMFTTSIEQSWGPRTCILCGYGEVAHRALTAKTPGEYVGQLDTGNRRRLNEGDIVEHVLISKWGKGTIAEVRPGEKGNEFRVQFPDAQFDPNVASAHPGRVPPKEGAWLRKDELRLVKRGPIVVATMTTDDMQLQFGLWDSGSHVLTKGKSALYNANPGAQLGAVIPDWTVCPCPDSTCLDMVDAEMYATHPNRGAHKVTASLCSLGVQLAGKCPLVK